MKLQKRKWAFTLIELLVVITIMGILATGAVNVFTTQLQKARDSTRISDLNALRNAVEQFYQDKANYPLKNVDFPTKADGIGNYIQTMPSDPRSWTSSDASIFEYLYNISPDRNTIPRQEYELSIHFENDGNIDNRADDSQDNWNDPNRLEVWIDVSDTDNSSAGQTKQTLAQKDDWLSWVNDFDCITPDWSWWAACDEGNDNPLVIK